MPSRPALLLSLLAAALAAPLDARPAAPQGGERWATLDRNGDGALDRGEAAARPGLAERFERIDRNGDGRLARDEVREAMRLADARRDAREAQARAMRARFDWLDANDDRALTLAELGDHAPRLRERFVAIDSNRDGRLVREELRAYARAQREARGQRGA